MKKKPRLFLIGLLLSIGIIFSLVYYYTIRFYDVALTTLEWVKHLSGNAVDLAKLNNKERQTLDHQAWTDLLIKHVDEDGRVNYMGFQKDSLALEAYLKLLSQNPPGNNWTRAEEIAYWINTYNAYTIQLILNHYPVQSIKEVRSNSSISSSPWDYKFFKIGEVPFDLGTIEHQILRKKFGEPRIHFAMNCASISCPKLRREAYTGVELERQLEEQAYDFLQNARFNKISQQATQLSKIFDWFQSDFTRNGDLNSFIKPYNPDFNPKLPLEFMEYNWDLNEQ